MRTPSRRSISALHPQCNAAELEAGMTAVNLDPGRSRRRRCGCRGGCRRGGTRRAGGRRSSRSVESDDTAVVNVESAEEAPVKEPAAEQVVANELPEDELGQVELDLDVAAEDEPPFRVNSEGNIRFGADVIRGAWELCPSPAPSCMRAMPQLPPLWCRLLNSSSPSPSRLKNSAPARN